MISIMSSLSSWTKSHPMSDCRALLLIGSRIRNAIAKLATASVAEANLRATTPAHETTCRVCGALRRSRFFRLSP